MYGKKNTWKEKGNFLAVQGLGLCAPVQGARIRSLVQELGSCVPRGEAKKLPQKTAKQQQQKTK